MFKRIIEHDLIKWKNSPIRKPLIIRGARQVGKTSVVRKFGSENFDQVIEINFEKKDQYSFFDEAKSVPDFLNRINLFFNQQIIPGKTLLFLDEIQESMNTLELLRFFAEEKPDIHVIAAGSLLEAKINNEWSVPVGRIDYKYLFPLTFFEYLQAKGNQPLLETLEQINLGEAFEYSSLVNQLFKEYVVVGGMPAVVDSFTKHNSYEEIQTILARLNTAYIDDIRKYARSVEESRYLEHVIEEGPKVAGTLFNYENFGGSSFRSREMANTIQAIEKIGLLHQVMAVSSTELPIFPKNKRAKKLIWLDVGLINFANKAYQELITGEYKGKVMEQVVGQNLIAQGINEEKNLYYWSKEKNEGSAEVDFCFQHHSRLVGLEVKSGNIGHMRSLFSLGNANKDVILIRVSWDNLGVEQWKFSGKKYRVLSLPFYLIDRWEDVVNQFIS
jgi:uncharacterized protein